jgi:NAD(P)-dependent dehydrogenase (short-subunit alcohol dehydrogenase family)
MSRLKDKVAVITGAAGGIGAASARLFASEGSAVVLLDIASEQGEPIAESIRAAGGKAAFVRTDVTSEESVKQAMATAVSQFGKLDVLLNVAGGSSASDAPVHEVDMALWDKTISLDLKGTFLCCRHAIPAMIDGGSGAIVNISSWAALKHFYKHVYVSAKGGVVSLTRSLAGEYARHGIRANVICPGGVRSERNLARFGDAATKTDERSVARQRMLEQYPFFQGDPIDIAYVALFLASDEARMVTGATIPADGGRSSY